MKHQFCVAVLSMLIVHVVALQSTIVQALTLEKLQQSRIQSLMVHSSCQTCQLDSNDHRWIVCLFVGADFIKKKYFCLVYEAKSSWNRLNSQVEMR